jgi:hypothetical protein
VVKVYSAEKREHGHGYLPKQAVSVPSNCVDPSFLFVAQHTALAQYSCSAPWISRNLHQVDAGLYCWMGGEKQLFISYNLQVSLRMRWKPMMASCISTLVAWLMGFFET